MYNQHHQNQQYQQYGPPQGQYYQQPPPQGAYPPQPGYPAQGPPAGQWQQPPPAQGGHYGAPPVPPHPGQGHDPNYYGAPPQQHYGAPAPQYGQQYPPQQQQQYGAPGYPPQQQSYAQPPQGPQAPPSPGYDPHMVANVDTSRDADACRTAMKGFGTDEKELIRVLAVSVPDPVIMHSLRQTYAQRHRRDLVKDIEKETSGYFEEGLVALVRGPLEQDVFNLQDALAGAGTKEDVLDDVLLGRSNADINAIKAAYQRTYNRSLQAAVRDDLSMKTERMYDMVLAAQRADEQAPVLPQQVQADATELQRATEGQIGTAQLAVCDIFVYRSAAQLRAVADEFQRRYQRPLRDVIRSEFSGHMQDALLRLLDLAHDRAMADADRLEAAMSGMGTKDRLLINRLVRIHWDRQHMQRVNAAYQHKYRKELWRRIDGETRGDYKRLAVALADPNVTV